jgi:3-oxoacyl-[acyl-carrier protein] reductase
MCIEDNHIKPCPNSKPLGSVLITGGHGSLGSELVRTFQLNGFNTIAGPKADSFEQVENFLTQCELSEQLPLNAFINNHGTNHLNWIGQLAEEDFKVLDTNLKLPLFWVDQLLKRNMLAAGARVLNIRSHTYRVPQRCTAAYCASKAGLVQLNKVMARELAPKGFVVNALAPGKITDTKMAAITDTQVNALRGWSEEQSEGYAASLIPMGRYTTREEVALAAIKILHLPAYINGTVIDMTGGQ